MAKFLAKVGRDPKTCATQIAAFCRDGTPRSKPRDQRGQRGGGRRRRRQDDAGGDEEEEGEEEESKSATTREGKKNRVAFASDDLSLGAPTPSTASLAEVLATFGFVFEGAGAAVKPSVAEAFAMLRLHAQPAEARAAGEAAKRYLQEQ